MRERQAGSLTEVKLLAFITDYKGIVTLSAESGGKEPTGFELVPEKVHVILSEFFATDFSKIQVGRRCYPGKDANYRYYRIRIS
jgi:hypothetical protein